jgi:hypothetical protein
MAPPSGGGVRGVIPPDAATRQSSPMALKPVDLISVQIDSEGIR